MKKWKNFITINKIKRISRNKMKDNWWIKKFKSFNNKINLIIMLKIKYLKATCKSMKIKYKINTNKCRKINKIIFKKIYSIIFILMFLLTNKDKDMIGLFF